MTYFNQGGGFAGGRFNRRPSFNRGSDRSEMFDAQCDECGKPCQVPFRPSGSKPVYCSSCFEMKNGGSDRGSDRGPRRDFGRRLDRDSVRVFPQSNWNDRGRDNRDDRDNRGSKQVNFAEELVIINAKLDLIMRALDLKSKKPEKNKETFVPDFGETKKESSISDEMTSEKPKKEKKSKKKKNI